jgi:hypothetical protein
MELIELIKNYGGQGIFFCLFLYLFMYQQKKNEEREAKYQQVIEQNQQVIEKFADGYTAISQDVKEIKQIISK